MRGQHELTAITKAYDLVLWSCRHTARFPRSHRFVLGERIERNLYDLLEGLVQARYTRERRPLLVQANLTLEVLRFQVRLAKDLQCLRTNSYGFAAKALDERPSGTSQVASTAYSVPGAFAATPPAPGKPARRSARC